MEWIDISLPIDARYPSWPGCPGMELRPLSRIEDGAEANNTALTLFSHFGTHLDAGLHFIAHGQSVDHIPISQLIGRCRVIDCTGVPVITAPVLSQQPLDGVARLLCKTDNSRCIHDAVFHTDYVGLDYTAARYLLERRIRLVGVDYFSAATLPEAVAVHQLFLGAGGIFLEGIDLGKVLPGDYQLLALPIRVSGAEAAAARVVLGRQETRDDESAITR
jgi:arylformamidase